MFNIKILLIVFALFVITDALVAWKAYNIGYDRGAGKVQALWDAAKNKATDDGLNTKEAQDENDNAAVDIDAITRRLLDGSF